MASSKINEATIVQNNFFDLLGQALCLYKEARTKNDFFVKKTLISSTILTSVYCLEAAANSVITIPDKKIDEKTTLLNKFSTVLEMFTDKKIIKGCPQYQNVNKLIKLRNETVHPKILERKTTFSTSIDNQTGLIEHTETPTSTQENLQRLSLDINDWNENNAFSAIKSVIDFLEIYFCTWWGLDKEICTNILLPEITKSNEKKSAFSRHTINLLREFNLELKFIIIPDDIQKYA